MLRQMMMRKLGPVGIALTAYDVWRRIPPTHRKRILKAARQHGPRLASQVRQRRQGPRPPR